MVAPRLLPLLLGCTAHCQRSTAAAGKKGWCWQRLQMPTSTWQKLASQMQQSKAQATAPPHLRLERSPALQSRDALCSLRPCFALNNLSQADDQIAKLLAVQLLVPMAVMADGTKEQTSPPLIKARRLQMDSFLYLFSSQALEKCSWKQRRRRTAGTTFGRKREAGGLLITATCRYLPRTCSSLTLSLFLPSLTPEMHVCSKHNMRCTGSSAGWAPTATSTAERNC